MTPTRPTLRGPQTFAQAKKEFNKHGPRLSSQEQRQLDRGVELYRRAEKIRDAAKRRKDSARRRQEKEQKDREARRRLGIASQKPYASPHQLRLEAFVGIDRTNEVYPVKNEAPPDKSLKDKHPTLEPWAEDDIDDCILLGTVLPEKNKDIAKVETGLINARSTMYPQDQSIPNHKPDHAAMHTTSTVCDDWEEFLISNTQIERDMSGAHTRHTPVETPHLDHFLALLSTQDVNSSFGDLEDSDPVVPLSDIQAKVPSLLEHQQTLQQRELDSILMPPPRLPTVKGKDNSQLMQNLCSADFSFLDFILSSQDCREIG